MKRKIFVTLLAALMLSLILVAFVACDPSDNKGFTVTFVADGRTISKVACEKGTTTVQEPAVPNKYGYTGAWENYTLNGKDLTVNAVYTAKQYTVIFNYNGAEGSYLPYATVTFDRIVGTLPQPTKTDNYFAGWYFLDERISQDSVWYIDSDEQIVLTAKWLPSTQALTYTYNKSAMTATVKSAYSYMTDVIVPSTYNGYTVTAIADGAFSYCRSLTNVTISASVSSVGERLFAGCSALTSIVVASDNQYLYSEGNCIISKSYKTLEAGAVCSEIPSDVDSIGSGAFRGVEIRSINLPNGVRRIGEEAFAYSGLTNVTIPNSVLTLGKSAFSNCVKFQSVTFNSGSTLTEIPSSAFENCDSLQQVSIPDSVQTIGSRAFTSCGALTTVTFGSDSKLRTIGGEGFGYCYDLASINLPAQLESIDGMAFYHCDELTEITLAATIKYIGYSAFSISGVKDVYYLGTIADWCQVDIGGYASDNPMNFADNFYVKGDGGQWQLISDIQLPDGLTAIGDYQFNGLDHVDTLYIPKSVTKIGSHAFGWCTFTDVYYDGTWEDWQQIQFGYGNNPYDYATNFYVRDASGNWVKHN